MVHEISVTPLQVSSNIHPFIKDLYNNPRYSDLKLKVNTTNKNSIVLNCHKLLLHSYSYFRPLVQELTLPTQNELEVTIDDEFLELFQMMIRYIYGGELEGVPLTQVPKLLFLANKFEIKSLKECCGEILGKNVTAETVISYLNLARDSGGVESLQQSCAAFLAKHFKEHSDVLMTMDSFTFRKMLESSDIVIKNEKEILECIFKYSSQFTEKSKRDEVLSKLLPAVRFNLFSVAYLVESVENDPMIKHLPVLHKLLYETYRFKVMPEYPPSYNTKYRKGLMFQLQFNDLCGPNIIISPDKKHALNNGTTYSVATSGDGYDEGVFIWRIKISLCNYLGVGIVDATLNNYNAEFHNVPGCYVYYMSGPAYTDGRSDGNTETFTTGAVISVVLDMNEKYFRIFKNGVLIKEVRGLSGNKRLGMVLRNKTAVHLLTEDEEVGELQTLLTHF